MNPTDDSPSTFCLTRIAHVRRGHEARHSAGACSEHAEARLAYAPALLRAHLERHGETVVQTDPAAPERHDVGSDAGPEVEDIRAFEEERPLFREEDAETRDVGAALVDLGFGEVCVNSQEGECV